MPGTSGSAGAEQAPGGADMLMQFFPLILMFAIFYFLLIRPQQKRAKAMKSMLSTLKKGDFVVTNAGFMGRIMEIDDQYCTIECGDANLRMTRASVAGLVDKDGKPLQADIKKK